MGAWLSAKAIPAGAESLWSGRTLDVSERETSEPLIKVLSIKPSDGTEHGEGLQTFGSFKCTDEEGF
jgi:hypothetical protein